MPKILPFDNDHKPGTWKALLLPLGRKYVRSATVTCPECGKVASLSDHQIGDDGTVSPSLLCPYDDCNFLEYVQLEGWDPKPVE